MLISQLVIVIGIVVISFILSLKRLSYGFFLFIILSPLMHKELFSLMIWDLLPIRLAFAGMIFASGIHFLNWLKKSRYPKKKILDFVKNDVVLILLISLWIVRVISLAKSQQMEESLLLLAFFSSIVLAYPIFKYIVIKYKETLINNIVNIFLLLGLGTSVFGVIQYILRKCCRETIGGVWVNPGYIPRLGSSFWDVNHFGAFLIILIPVFFSYVFSKKALIWNILCGLCAIFLGIMLILTGSRSAWFGIIIGMFISMIIYFVKNFKKPLLILLIGFLVGGMGLIAYTSYQNISIRDKVAGYMHYRLDSTDTHLLLLEGAGEVFVENLAVGAGYGDFDTAFRNTKTSKEYFGREPKLRDMKVPPHSVWGEVLAETGAVGIILYSLLMIFIVSGLITAIFKTKQVEQAYLGIGILGGTLSILVSGLFYSYNMEFYWLFLFLTAGFSFVVLQKNWTPVFIIKWWYDKKFIPYLIILIPTFFYVFLKLGSTTLIDWDEAIYAKVAKNIVQTGEWMSLRWDNLDKYWFEKPPLYMWLTALIFKVTGFNSFGARFISAFFGVTGIALTYKFGEKLYNKLVGGMAALMVLSTVHYLYYSRNGMLDVTVTFFVLATVYFFYIGIKRGGASMKHRKILFLLSGVALGLGVMTKAVIGLLPVPIILIYLIYLKLKKEELPSISNLFVLVISFLIIAAPWHIYSVIVHNGSFVDKYFIDHIIGRGLSGLGHEKPIWWFLEVIKVSFRIWVFPLAGALLFLPFKDKKRNELVLLFISSVIVLIFFSVSKDKLQWYIIPIYPFLALLAARFIEQFIHLIKSMLRKDILLDSKVMRSGVIFVVFLISVFSVVVVRDRVYYPDFNKDKVALVKIHNDLYPIKHHPDKKLYYHGVAPPVLLFYSDHKIKYTDEEHMLKTINDAAPNQSYTFLIREGMYYSVKDKQDRISAPLVLDVKGAAGEWILTRSKSRVELLRAEFALVAPQKAILEKKEFLKTITSKERVSLEVIKRQYDEVVRKLTDYGYPPF